MKRILIISFVIVSLITAIAIHLRKTDGIRDIVYTDYKIDSDNIKEAGFEIIIPQKVGTITLSPRKSVIYMVDTLWQQYDIEKDELSIEQRVQLWKALAVMCRTNIVYQWQIQGKPERTVLPNDSELIKGINDINQNDSINLITTAVDETKGTVLTYNDNVIVAPFFYLSAGNTRQSQEYPYLKKVTCVSDIQHKECVNVKCLDNTEFWTILENKVANETRGEYMIVEHTLDNIRITTDSSGYADSIQINVIDKKSDISVVNFSALEFRKLLSSSSPYFTIENSDNGQKIMMITKGIGEGYGLSLEYALQLAQKGYSYEEIIAYFFNETSLYRRW